LGKLIFKIKDLDLPKNFVFDFPLTLEEGDVEVPFFSWNDPRAWRKNLAEQLPKMKVRFGEIPLRYDDSCDCLKDPDFNLGLVFGESSDPSALGLKILVNEYRPEPSFSSDEELLAETGWGKTLAFLSEADRNRIRKILPFVSVQRPPELPETKENLLHDIRYLVQAAKDPEILKTLELIKKSAKESAPLPVLYFASLLAGGNRDCEEVPAWIAEISAKSQDPMLLGKSFAVLSQCENDPKKQKQLAEMAKMYLPKDPYIKALLHRIHVEHFRSQKTDGQALRYVKDPKTEKELSLLVIEGFLKREARRKSLAGTLKWAKEKYKISRDDRDLNLVNRLEHLPAPKSAATPAKPTPRRPASKP
ncbi:MAG TPA: hypothetical protein PL182_11530, partial [Pseudobdellovibrionaceae bacterium]|nr:hypothetical protein [Pseudobdellovibrionaceae bacterium]